MSSPDDAFTPQREMYTKAWRLLVIFGTLIAVAGCAIGYVSAGWPGIWGGILGVAVGVAFSAITIWVMRVTMTKKIQVATAFLGASWLIKMIVVVIFVWAIRSAEFYSKPVFFLVLVAEVIAAILIDAYVVKTARIPYVLPETSASKESSGDKK
jgi:hypothetical protein